MGEARGSEEDAHDRARGGDAEQDGDGAKHPALLFGAVTAACIEECTAERVEKKRVEEEDGGALEPSADGVRAHGVGGDADDGAERKDDALKQDGVTRAAPEEQRQEQDEGEAAEDMDVGEGGVRDEVGVERCKLRRGVGAGRRGESDDAADDDGEGDRNRRTRSRFSIRGET